MAVNEEVYGAKEVWYAAYGNAAYSKNTVRTVNYNTSDNAYTRFWSQMYTNNSHNYTIYNNWDNRNDSFIDMSIVPFGIGKGSGLSHIDWYTYYNGTVSTEPANQDIRNITNIAFCDGSDKRSDTWCLDGAGTITGGTSTAYTYYQRLCYNRWSTLYGTACSTDSAAAGGGSAEFYTTWFNSRLFSYLPTKNLVLTPYATIVNSSGVTTNYTKIDDVVQNKNNGKLIRFGCKFSYKPTGARIDIPFTPFFMDDSNVQKGFNNYPIQGGTPEEVSIAIKLPILYSTIQLNWVLLGSGSEGTYINTLLNNNEHYTWPTFQSQILQFTPEIISGKLFMSCDISQLSDEVLRNELMRQMAFMGMLFVDDPANVNDPIYSDNMYLGSMVDGVTNGEYTHGLQNLLQPQMQWDDFFQSEYTPDNPPIIDNNDYNTGMNFNAPWMATPNNLYSIGVLQVSTVLNLFSKFWQCFDDNLVGQPDEQTYSEFSINEFLVTNPIDCIISLKLFPYSTDSDPEAAATTIKLGKYNTALPAKVADKYKRIDCGSVTIFPYFGDCWIDRLTDYTLYAPFCGTLRLDPNIYMGRDISLSYIIDQITGACTAVVQVISEDGVSIHEDTLTGTLAVDVPITGLNQATIQSQIFNANQQLKIANINCALSGTSAALQLAGNVAMGNVPGVASAAVAGVASFFSTELQAESAQYNLHHQQVSPRIVGGASPLNSQCMDYIPRVIVSIPKIQAGFSEDNYKHSKGYSCLIAGKIGDNSGYCQMQNVDLSGIAATQREKEQIRSLLASGVYA